MSKCTRCGKERIIKKTYTEKLEKNNVVYTVTICPDPECQKIVEKGLLAEENKRRIMREEQEVRARESVLRKLELKKANFAQS